MDVTTGNISEIDENGRGEIYYLQSTMRAWYDDLEENFWKAIIVADILFCQSGRNSTYELLHQRFAFIS
ncbi:MAG: hypothetical protein ACLUR5_01620 [Eubacterium ventriosum]